MLLKPVKLSGVMQLCCMPAFINLEVDDSFDLGMTLPIHVTNAELKQIKPHSFFWTVLKQTLGIIFCMWHFSHTVTKIFFFLATEFRSAIGKKIVWATVKPGHMGKWFPHYFSLWKYLGHNLQRPFTAASFCFPCNSGWLYWKFGIRPKIGLCHSPFISSFIIFTINLISGTKCN